MSCNEFHKGKLHKLTRGMSETKNKVKELAKQYNVPVDEDEDNYWYYNEKHDYWTNVIEGFPFDSYTCILKKKNLNIESIYRYLRKWNLPVGIKITIDNVRFDFGWEIITK